MKVFISHTFADDDQELSVILQKILAEKDVEGYLAEKKQEYDLLIRDKIRDEIEKSDYIVGIVTNKARESASVNQELGYALRAGVRMIIMLEENAKNGVLTHGMELEEFTREKFEESCKKILNYIVTKGPRKKISEEDKKWLIDNVYRLCYNAVITVYKTRDFITYVPANPWENLEAYAKLKTEEDMVKLLDQYSVDLNKWQRMWIDFQNNFQNKRDDLAKIVKPAFEKTNLLDSTGRINTLEGSSWDVQNWLHNCSDVLFNNDIKTEEELYQILRNEAIRRWGTFTEVLDKWKKENPTIFSELLKVIPDLVRMLGAKYTYRQMDVQRQVLKESIENLTFALEQKLK